MRKLALTVLFLTLHGSSLGQVRVMFTHQSVGRYIISAPERAAPPNRAANPIRDLLAANVAFWDHDYYNYSTDLVTPGTYIPGSILDPAGDIWPPVAGFGAHLGSEVNDTLLDHLLADAFQDFPSPTGQAFRDSMLSRFDIAMIMPGYADIHMNTVSSLANYQLMLNSVSDWWHTNNPGKYLVVMTSSSVRHPSDYSGGVASWPDTPAGHAEAESDAAAYRELDLWLQNTWADRHPENRYFSTWWLVVNHSGPVTEKFFTKDIFTGAGAGDSSGDNHLNSAGSDFVQEALVTYINELAVDFEGNVSAVDDIPLETISLFNPTPNPFNPSTMLSFEMTEPSKVRLSIYDLLGNHVTTLLDDFREAGKHQVSWDGRNSNQNRVSSGIYLYRLEAGSFSETKRMVLLK